MLNGAMLNESGGEWKPSCAAAADLVALSQEFPQFDGGLLEEMLQDQDGDVEEVHACLRVSSQFQLCFSCPASNLKSS